MKDANGWPVMDVEACRELRRERDEKDERLERLAVLREQRRLEQINRYHRRLGDWYRRRPCPLNIMELILWWISKPREEDIYE